MSALAQEFRLAHPASGGQLSIESVSVAHPFSPRCDHRLEEEEDSVTKIMRCLIQLRVVMRKANGNGLCTIPCPFGVAFLLT